MTEKCKFCKGIVSPVTEDEGGLQVSWCYNCCALGLGMEEEDIEFYNIGKKPDFFPEE